MAKSAHPFSLREEPWWRTQMVCEEVESLYMRITKTTCGGRKTSTLLCESEPDLKPPKKWDRGRVEWVFSFDLRNVKRKSLLVEWVCGKVLTVLPHPPLLSNNCSQLIDSRSLMGGRHMEKSQWTPRVGQTPLNLRNRALFIYRCIVVTRCRFILNDVYIYMIPIL